MRYETDSGHAIHSADFWPLVDRRREAHQPMTWCRSAFLDRADGTWYYPDTMTIAERKEAREAHAQSEWWEAHKRDVTVIPLLSDAELTTFRLCADIRADIPAMTAATAELWRRGIRDYPVAV